VGAEPSQDRTAHQRVRCARLWLACAWQFDALTDFAQKLDLLEVMRFETKNVSQAFFTSVCVEFGLIHAQVASGMCSEGRGKFGRFQSRTSSRSIMLTNWLVCLWTRERWGCLLALLGARENAYYFVSSVLFLDFVTHCLPSSLLVLDQRRS